jgi:hypothetical protein
MDAPRGSAIARFGQGPKIVGVFISARLKRPAKSAKDRFAHLRRQAKKALNGELELKAKAK